MRFTGSLIFIHSSCLPVSCAIDIEISSSVINIPPTVKLISQAFAGRESYCDRWALTQSHIRIVLRMLALRNRRITRCMCESIEAQKIGLQVLCLPLLNSMSFRGNVGDRHSPNPSYDASLPHTCENSFVYETVIYLSHMRKQKNTRRGLRKPR